MRTIVAMALLGNLLWLVLAGWWVALAYVVAGIVNFVTIIGIPFGIQAFKLAGYALWPFGRVVVTTDTGYGPLAIIGNVLWLILTGWELALAHVVAGLLLCLTIVGIPLAIASFKMVWLALVPFGKEVVPASAVQPDASVFHGGVQPRT
ncbi:MAG TPA: YccF domain-containing protein [Euzebyales bacterium]|nr:YccF domain-containing protein [Euzebyales bacterium]